VRRGVIRFSLQKCERHKRFADVLTGTQRIVDVLTGTKWVISMDNSTMQTNHEHCHPTMRFFQVRLHRLCTEGEQPAEQMQNIDHWWRCEYGVSIGSVRMVREPPPSTQRQAHKGTTAHRCTALHLIKIYTELDFGMPLLSDIGARHRRYIPPRPRRPSV
jgi:hypothetical protein